jgi:hypothetical protein
MYKVEIEIGDWSWDETQKVTIESGDFDKIKIIQEFIEFQKDYGWAVDYDVVESEEDDEEELEEEELEDEDEETEYQVGDIVEDDDGLVWELVG